MSPLLSLPPKAPKLCSSEEEELQLQVGLGVLREQHLVLEPLLLALQRATPQRGQGERSSPEGHFSPFLRVSSTLSHDAVEKWKSVRQEGREDLPKHDGLEAAAHPFLDRWEQNMPRDPVTHQALPWKTCGFGLLRDW